MKLKLFLIALIVFSVIVGLWPGVEDNMEVLVLEWRDREVQQNMFSLSVFSMFGPSSDRGRRPNLLFGDLYR